MNLQLQFKARDSSYTPGVGRDFIASVKTAKKTPSLICKKKFNYSFIKYYVYKSLWFKLLKRTKYVLNIHV